MLSRGNILVVDDEINLCRILDAKLTKSGYEVMTVHDGLQAVEKVQEKKFDLVLLDLVLPKLGGLEALQKIRKINSDVPVIIMTACENADAVSQALSEGASAFVSKPFDLDRLVMLVQTTSTEARSLPTETTVMMDSSGIFRKGQPVTVETAEGSEDSLEGRIVERSEGRLILAVKHEGTKSPFSVEQVVQAQIRAADALYRFTSRVVRHDADELTLDLPRVMYRLQRRRHPRVGVKTPIELRLHPGGAKKMAYTQDVSAGGMSIITSSPFAVGQTLDVEARAILHLEQFHCSGQVLRCDRLEGTGSRDQYELVLTFHEPDPELRRALLQHLASSD